MDQCLFNKETGELTFLKGPDEIAKDIPEDNPAHAHLLTCKYSCDENPPPSILGVCLGDSTPPAISSYYPADKVNGVSVNSAITVTFNEAMDASTINTNTFIIDHGVTGRTAYDSATKTATFTPDPPLSGNTTYAVTITTGAKDTAGNPLPGALIWNFTTEASAVPGNRIAFVTSGRGNGNLSTWADAGEKTGIAAGDTICQARANAAGLSGTYAAWLSDSTNDAYCHIHNLTGKKADNCGQTTLPAEAGPWLRMDGLPFRGMKISGTRMSRLSS
ncbi:MAG: Ig-like domain-containing protein [Nitrospirae bacterium]|nr:Ig-like domain-containing protein [Nitrospirota bacterium]